MIQIVKAGAIEATHYVHYVLKNDSFMKGPLLRNSACRFNWCPVPVLYLVREQIVKALLRGVDPTKNEDCLVHHDS